jgi:c-di-GMP-binding flagellar brake protein YcgR
MIEARELKDILQAGMSVEVRIKQGAYRGQYRSKIEDTGEGTLVVGTPYSEKGFVLLRPGDKVQLIFVRGYDTFGFETEVLRRQTHSLPAFIVSLPPMAIRLQRRRFVRTRCFQDVQYQVIGANRKLGAKQDAHTLDLSGGGVQLQISQKLDPGDVLLVALSLYSETHYIPSVVNRVDEVGGVPDNGRHKKKYKVSLEFREIAEWLRDRIVKQVIDIERDLRRRGLI